MGPTRDFWDYFGRALVVFALCAGVGMCSYLESSGAALRHQAMAARP